MKRLAAGLAALQFIWLSGAAMAACPRLSELKPSGLGSGQGAATFIGPPKLTPPPRNTRMPQGPIDQAVITLERGQCMGNCPAYRVELHGDGRVLFTGARDVVAPGEHRAAISRGDFACLLGLFREARFWSLREAYVAQISDGPAYLVTVTIGGKTKRVSDYLGRAAGMPSSVTLLEDQIDRLAAEPFVRGNGRTLDLLTAEGFDFKSAEAGNILAEAAAAGQDDLALGLLARGAPPDGQQRPGGFVPAPPWGPPTALEAAAKAGRPALVKALLAAGAPGFGAPAGVRARALFAAAQFPDLETVQTLLAAGADVNEPIWGQQTALMGASESRNPEKSVTQRLAVMRALLAAGADPRRRDDTGGTALHKAWGPPEVALLVQAGADLEARDKEGRTPLLASYFDDKSVALIEAGADVRAAANNGETVAQLAYRNSWKRTLALLAARGVPPYKPPPRKR